jgi:hypothetical protein
MYSPYHFSSNQPIHAPELEGLESAWDLNSRDPNYQMMNAEQREQFRNSAQKPAMDGNIIGATWGPLAAGVRATWATGRWRAVLRLLTKEAVEEGATQAVERITGIPMVVSPMDVLQAARKGGRFIGELAKLEPHERQRAAEYLKGGSVLERTDIPGTGGADFRVDGKLTEFKSLQGDAVNHTTGVGRPQDATKKPGVQMIDLDIRTPSGSSSDATTIYNRFAGTDQGKAFLGGGGEVRIATQDGMMSFGGNQ